MFYKIVLKVYTKSILYIFTYDTSRWYIFHSLSKILIFISTTFSNFFLTFLTPGSPATGARCLFCSQLARFHGLRPVICHPDHVHLSRAVNLRWLCFCYRREWIVGSLCLPYLYLDRTSKQPGATRGNSNFPTTLFSLGFSMPLIESEFS